MSIYFKSSFLFLITFLICCSLYPISAATINQEVENEWNDFKKTYNKQYNSDEEEQFRKSIFVDNFNFIISHNEKYVNGESSFNLAVNEFADMTLSEFRRFRNGLIAPTELPNKKAWRPTSIDVDSLPAEVDWTKRGVVTPIKDQGNCGSCWAFSAVVSLEGQHALNTGKLVSLSEQELVDCSAFDGDHGCNGGWMDNAFHFVIENSGIETEATYPYVGVQQKCAYNQSDKMIGATITNWFDIESQDEEMLQLAVANVGPVSTAIDASSLYFMFYGSGVYDHKDCSSIFLDHGVAVVGYGTVNGTEYWKVKNSWGTTWGMKGYILMARNKKNQCGIATHASYPIV